ncbi:MFS transporter [Rudaeicoccus suwonensis]|uniref:EmrB/QacA subfamily drug resistance transporter n=1 Tax=Rudaeicoccus suwonensis TaxID=657409 RepID=A0A561E9L7_9MICO|nr:MFS transporter [Rudaeicoccus suwonensis]TWE12301.1 EmrB/QacA subfamily drug resistance transporter [Rudaeicoccus suwonensis]
MRSNKGALTAVCVGLATVVSAVSSLMVALPDVARHTGASQTQLSWIVDGYALTLAALLLPGGYLGDRLGRRRVMLCGLGLIVLAAAGGALVTDPTALIGVRVVMGMAAALIMPATLSTITATFPPDERVRGVAIWAGLAGGSAVLGLFASGLLLEWFSWQAIFWFTVALATAATGLTIRSVPESRAVSIGRFDVGGAALSVLGLGVLVYSIIEAPIEGWGSARTLLGLAAGAVILCCFAVWELRNSAPLLDVRLFRHRGFAAGMLSVFSLFFVFFGFIFVFMQYLQFVRAWSPLVAACAATPVALGLLPGARIAPRLVERFGSRVLALVGMALVAIGMSGLATVHATTDYWLIAVLLWLAGTGMGWAMTPATTDITDSLPQDQQGVASAMNDVAREVGGALGIAVLGSVLSNGYRSGLPLHGVPQQVATVARESVAAAVGLPEPMSSLARSAFVDGLGDALGLAAVVLIVCALGVALVAGPTGRRKSDAADSVERPRGGATIPVTGRRRQTHGPVLRSAACEEH